MTIVRRFRVSPMRRAIYCGTLCAVLSFVVAACAAEDIRLSRYTEGMNAQKVGQHEKAFATLQPLAEDDSFQLSATAKYAIASQLEKGQGVPQDMAAAILWFEKVAASDSELTANLAKHRLGVLYSEGKQIPKDISRGIKWLDSVTGRGRMKALSLERLGYVYSREKNHGKAIEVRKEAIKIHERRGDEQAAAMVYFFLGTNFVDKKEYSDATKHFRKSSNLYKSSEDLKNAGKQLRYAGSAELQSGQPENAISTYSESLNLTRDLDDKGDYILSLIAISGAYFQIGKFGTAFRYQEEALKVSREQSNADMQFDVLHGLAVTVTQWGQFERALKLLKQWGQFERALKLLKGALTLADKKIEDQSFHKMLILYGIGDIYIAIRRPNEAKKYLDDALKFSERLKKPAENISATILRKLGDYHNIRGEKEAALARYEQALAAIPTEPSIVQLAEFGDAQHGFIGSLYVGRVSAVSNFSP